MVKVSYLTIMCQNSYTSTSTLSEIRNEIIDYKVLFINEGQFFTDLYDFVSEMLELDKIIFVCGLVGDFQRKNLDLY